MSRIRVWLRRAAILLVVLIVLIGVGAYFLYFRRDTLAAAPPHARIVPTISPLKGLAACWVDGASNPEPSNTAIDSRSACIESALRSAARRALRLTLTV